MKSYNNSKVLAVIRMLPLLQYIFPEIKDAFYYIDDDTKDEFVRIEYISVEYAPALNRFIESSKNYLHFNVNVNADSPAALVDDVWKECKRRFM